MWWLCSLNFYLIFALILTLIILGLIHKLILRLLLILLLFLDLSGAFLDRYIMACFGFAVFFGFSIKNRICNLFANHILLLIPQVPFLVSIQPFHFLFPHNLPSIPVYWGTFRSLYPPFTAGFIMSLFIWFSELLLYFFWPLFFIDLRW